VPSEELLKRYLKALQKEFLLRQEEISSYRFVTFYAGGGTPSLAPIWFYEEVFGFLKTVLDFSPREITLEANPEGLNKLVLVSFREIFNRLSLGAQSLNPEGLKALGRRHQVEEVKMAFEAARTAGFENIGLDLIFAWPGQTLKELKEELEKLVSFGPEHISCYELTLEEGTPFYQAARKGKILLPAEEDVVSMHELIHSFLVAKGYEHYEISNFARPGFRCRHNLFYWEARPYLGLGPGAASFFGKKRYKNLEDLSLYLKNLEEGKPPPREEEILSQEVRFREAVILGLRLLKGIKLESLVKRFGINPLEYYGETLEKLLKEGLLEISGENLRLTGRGRLLANVVFRELV